MIVIHSEGHLKVLKGQAGKVMGIDPSTKTGIVVLEGDDVLVEAWVNYPDETGLKRLQLIANYTALLAVKFQPDAIYIEGLNFNNKFTLVLLAQLRALLTDRLDKAGFRWMDVPPNTLKKWVTGSGAADKEAMWWASYFNWGRELGQCKEDVMEAYALARLGQAHLSGMDPGILKGVHNGSDGDGSGVQGSTSSQDGDGDQGLQAGGVPHPHGTQDGQGGDPADAA